MTALTVHGTLLLKQPGATEQIIKIVALVWFLQMWGRALRIAETKKHARLAEVAAKIGRRLQRMGQNEQAGELLLGAGDAKVTFTAVNVSMS